MTSNPLLNKIKKATGDDPPYLFMVVYGEPKVGKTRFLTTCPGPILALAC